MNISDKEFLDNKFSFFQTPFISLYFIFISSTDWKNRFV